jgi:hypothetical protein
MKRLVRLYPLAWRERYGDEMEALLEERAPGPFEIADLLLGALDAHLHLRVLAHHSEHRKGITMTGRIAGLAAIVGGLLWTLFLGLDRYLDATGQHDELPARLLLAVPAMAFLVALAGLSSFLARVHRAEVWTSFGIAAISVGLLTAGWGIIPLVAREPAWGIGFMGALGLLMGSLLFARVTYVTGALSHGAAMLLGLGAALHLVSIGIAVVMGESLAGYLIVGLGGVAFAAGWIGLGIDAIRRDRLSTSPRPSPT